MNQTRAFLNLPKVLRVPRGAVLLDWDPRSFEHLLKGFYFDLSLPKKKLRLDHWTELLQDYAAEIVASKNPGYVTGLRMRHAISLLSQNYKVEEVSREVGYDSAFAFSTAFKRFSGRPPLEFQKP